MSMPDLATIKEKEGAEKGLYPPDWPEIARKVKEEAGWKCERCGHPHDPEHGFTLTVHHLVDQKWNLKPWNLVALCQRCHLRIQARVDFLQDLLDGVHADWLAKRIRLFNEEATKEGRQMLSLTQILTKDHSREWPTT